MASNGVTGSGARRGGRTSLTASCETAATSKLQVDLIMGSDHLGTSLPAGDTGFEQPQFAFWHDFNSGARA